MSSQIDKVAKTYRALAQIPALAGAKFISNGNYIKSVWSQRNLDKGKTTKFVRMHVLSSNLNKMLDTIPVDISNQLLSCLSPSEKYCAIVRDVDSKQLLEIWTDQNFTRSVDLKSLDIHGDVYTDVEFGSLTFSPDETKLLYIAEKKQPKSEPFLKRAGNKKENKDEGDVTQGQEYIFRQDWGEQLVGKIQSTIVQYDITNDTVQVLSGMPENVCPAHVLWAPDGSYVVGVAYKTNPRKLGLIYCTNRPSTIFKLDFNGNYVEVNLQNKAVKAPRFTLDGRTLIWLQRNAGGPHAGCMSLVKTDVPLTESSNVNTIVDIVQTEININNGEVFYGLYNSDFPTRCWASDRRLLLSTIQKNEYNTYTVDIDSGNITVLPYDSGSQLVLDVCSDIVVVNRRNFRRQDILAFGKLPTKGQESTIEWTEITPNKITDGLENYTYRYMDIIQNNDDAVKRFTAIYLGPESGSDATIPVVVWPHGGPHSAFGNNISLEANLFASFGYAILFVNFRGSIGFGEASVNFLPGRVGTSDVEDCTLATTKVLELYPWLNPKRIALVGGSHGGFLVTHLSGQYPDMYQVVVARNPVIDIASLSTTSDIPDWSYVVAGSEYTQVGEPNEQLLLTMRKCSPIQHAHKVKAPTLLQIGSNDLRVPPHQATDYYHRLRANGVPVKMHLYNDNHPLGTVPNEIDNLINTLLWIEEHNTKV